MIKQNIKELSFELDLFKKNVNTFSISCIYTSIMQSVHINSNYINVC